MTPIPSSSTLWPPKSLADAPGAFLLDSMCSNLIDSYDILVKFREAAGSGLSGRNGCFKGLEINPVSGEHEALVELKERRVIATKSYRLWHLEPAVPRNKGEHVLVISGDHRGTVCEGIDVRRKAGKVTVLKDSIKIDLKFDDVTRVTCNK
jgi:hypothetical protein